MVRLRSITLCKIHHSVYSSPFENQRIFLEVAGFEMELWLTLLRLRGLTPQTILCCSLNSYLCLNIFLPLVCVQLPSPSTQRQVSRSGQFMKWEALSSGRACGGWKSLGERFY